MNAARKIIGLVIIIFLGLPSLFGIIWAVGMIRATVSPEFLSELPREIIADIPGAADEIFREAQNPQAIANENTRAWFQAAAKTGISPKELMERTGLLAWMEGELSEALRQIGLVLRSERRPREIVISLRPLKEALLHPEIDRFLEGTLSNLPPCNEQGLQAWAAWAGNISGRNKLPACQPGLKVAKAVLLSERTRAVENIEDEIEIFKDVRGFRFFPFGLTGTVRIFSYFLFLIPIVLIFIGVIIATSSAARIFRWFGASVFLGGLPALALALFAKYFSLWAIKFAPFSWHDEWGAELGELVLDKVRWIPLRILDQLFTPVIIVAAVVCAVGIIIFALSFSLRNGARGERIQRIASPSSPPPEKP
jgi:hypothetical protein